MFRIMVHKSHINRTSNRMFYCLLMFSFFVTCISSSCREKDIVPNAPVEFDLNLNDPEYSQLNSVGNAVIVNESSNLFGYFGYNGVIIYRQSYNSFLAFEATCTYDQNRLEIRNGSYAYDPECGSLYQLGFYGSVGEGPAQYSLKQYTVEYQEGSDFIHVTN